VDDTRIALLERFERLLAGTLQTPNFDPDLPVDLLRSGHTAVMESDRRINPGAKPEWLTRTASSGVWI
jgi:hypothetical protein